MTSIAFAGEIAFCKYLAKGYKITDLMDRQAPIFCVLPTMWRRSLRFPLPLAKK